MSEERKSGCLPGVGCLLILSLILVIFAGIGLLYYFTSFRGQQALLSQDESRFDPILEKKNVLKLAGPGAQFLSFSASGVHRDGTIDLGSEIVPSRAYYQFKGARENPEAPPGVEPKHETITIRAWPLGFRLTQVVGPTKYYAFEWGLGKTTSSSSSDDSQISFPACSFKSFWVEAIKGGAPKNGVATISYDHKGYHFRIEGTHHSLKFDTSCALSSSR